MKIWFVYHKGQHERKAPEEVVVARSREEAEQLALTMVKRPDLGVELVESSYSKCDFCHNLALIEEMKPGKSYVEVCPTCYELGV